MKNTQFILSYCSGHTKFKDINPYESVVVTLVMTYGRSLTPVTAIFLLKVSVTCLGSAKIVSFCDNIIWLKVKPHVQLGWCYPKNVGWSILSRCYHWMYVRFETVCGVSRVQDRSAALGHSFPCWKHLNEERCWLAHIQTGPTNPSVCASEIRCMLHTLSTSCLFLHFSFSLFGRVAPNSP